MYKCHESAVCRSVKYQHFPGDWAEVRHLKHFYFRSLSMKICHSLTSNQMHSSTLTCKYACAESWTEEESRRSNPVQNGGQTQRLNGAGVEGLNSEKFHGFFVTSTYSPSTCIIVVLTKEPHSAPAALMKKGSWTCFTGGGLLHASVKRTLCYNGQRSSFKSLQVQIRRIKFGGGGNGKHGCFSKVCFTH